MAKDLTPDAWLASWSEDGTNITVPIASITGLTAAEADTTTGDIRIVLTKLLDRIITAYAGLAEADRPDTLSLTKSTNAAFVQYELRIAGSITTFTPGSDT